MIHHSSIEQAAKAWINPRIMATVETPGTPIDTESLFGLFDRYNSTTYYAGGGGGKGGGLASGGSTKCCASGTCDIFA